MMKEYDFVSPTVSDGKEPKVWKRYNSHIGPTDYLTPLGKRISGKNYCGVLSLAAGITAWCACRLQGRADVSSLHKLYEAIFAYQVDWRYFNEEALPYKDSIDLPMETSMVVGIEMSISDITNVVFFWKQGSVPDKGVFHMAHVVGYILPPKELEKYQKWLYATCDRLQEVASRPVEYVVSEEEHENLKRRDAEVEACHGVPLPPEVLNAEIPFNMREREELVTSFISSLDWEDNPFLANPVDMRNAGFIGEPYVG